MRRSKLPSPAYLDALWRWARRGNRLPPAEEVLPPDVIDCSEDVYQRQHGLRVPTREEADALMAEWQTDKDATDIALNAQMLYGQQFDTLTEDDFRDLAKAIQKYGDERAESAVERYQEWGE